MPAYFASDIHLRLDRPDRGQRFARWVDTLTSADCLTIVGDLCDFWFASRQFPVRPAACEGLQALALFHERGGSLTILEGNHDRWLGRFYEAELGARLVAGGFLDLSLCGLRVHLIHGHALRFPARWKGSMESRAFLAAYRQLPGPLARGLEGMLEGTKRFRRHAAEDRQLAAFRRYADSLAPSADLVVFGHVHRRVDDGSRMPRMIVLGDWMTRSSCLRIDSAGAAFVLDPVTDSSCGVVS